MKNAYADHLAVTAARERRGTDGLVSSGFESWLAGAQEKERYVEFLDLPSDAFAEDARPPVRDEAEGD